METLHNGVFKSHENAENKMEFSSKPPVLEDYDDNTDEYYTKAQDYWSKITPTVDGMLGGFGRITFIDIRSSISFLQKLYKIKPCPGKEYALDCGAGIGRVTKNLLIPHFEKVDMVEQDKNFCDKAREYVDDRKLGEIYNCGLQKFVPEANKYDIIWSQWVWIIW